MLRSFLVGVFGLFLISIPAATQGREHRAETKLSGYLLKIGDEYLAGLKGFEGGSVWAPVASESKGDPALPKKRIGAAKSEELTLHFGSKIPKPVCEWINAAWAGGAPAKDLSLIALDTRDQAIGSRDFVKACITETTISALDANSESEFTISVKVSAESIRTSAPGGKPSAAPSAPAVGNVFVNNFKLDIAGLDGSSIAGIQAIVVKSPAADSRSRRVDVPSLKITLIEGKAKSWTDWSDEFLLRGGDDAKEKSGTLEILDQKHNGVFRFRFSNLGVCRSGPAPWSSGGGATTPKLAVELYCEKMELEYLAK